MTMNRLLSAVLALTLGCASSVRSPAPNGVIVFFGDSITQEGDQPGGYVDLLRSRFRRPDGSGPTVIGAGVSGNKVPDLEARLDRDVLQKKPSVVVIYIGINDVWHFQLGIGGTSKERYESGLRNLISRISAADAHVILCTPSVIGEKTNGTNPLDAQLDAYAEISRKVAASTGAVLCDLRAAFLAELRQRNPENVPQGMLTRDGVHLNPAGNRFVAETIVACLQPIL
jgi:lysophospholipase L1-like esterase